MFAVTYGGYVWLPVLAFLCWVATLLGLLLLWTLRDDHRPYELGEATIVFISDAGAAHKALFVPGCACVFVFYSLTLVTERWLRHAQRIPGTVRKRERHLAIATVVFGVLGGVFLVLLSCFDAFSHSKLHWSFACLFIVSVGFSTVCNALEVYYLHQDHADRRHLRRSAIWKASIVSVAVLAAIVFGALYAVCRGKALDARCNRVTSAAGGLEWFIAFCLAWYFLTWIEDLWPAGKTSPRHQRRHQRHLVEKGLVPGGENGSRSFPTARDMSEASHA